MSIVQDYRTRLAERIDQVFDTQEESIITAAGFCADSIGMGKLAFTFGTGHGSFAAPCHSPPGRG